MCGICVTYGFSPEESTDALGNLAARGPDDFCMRIFKSVSNADIFAGFSLLSIMGSTVSERVEAQEQPFVSEDSSRVIMCNGEIYNSLELARDQNLGILGTPAPGSSDCAVIPELLVTRDLGHGRVCRMLDGDFAIVDIDTVAGTVTLARDPYGVRPLYFAQYDGVRWAVASELKGLPAGATCVSHVVPGTVETRRMAGGGELLFHYQYHQVPWLKSSGTCFSSTLYSLIRDVLWQAVAKRLQAGEGRHIGACLSGGLDSSLVAAIAAKELLASGRKLHTYSVGMSGSADLAFARTVADHIGSEHHEFLLSPEGCVADIPEVVRAIESFDVTTVRASVGNYNVGALVQIVNAETPGLNVRVVLNGDGADELLGGYLYMREAPNDAAFEEETTSLLENLHLFDVLRSERSMAAHGLESRSPFLDRQFVSLMRGLPTAMLRSHPGVMEKTVLRSAFSGCGLLPESVLWRRKEAFSDGMSGSETGSWFAIARLAAIEATQGRYENGVEAEKAWYRSIFVGHYGEVCEAAATPHYWMPKFVPGITDPSARNLPSYSLQ